MQANTDKLRMVCPKCSSGFKYPVAKAGEAVNCPGCKQAIILDKAPLKPPVTPSFDVPDVPPPSLDMQVACPHCDGMVPIHRAQAGAEVGCPKCKGRFQVPLPKARLDNGGASETYVTVADPFDLFVGKKIAAGVCGIVLGGLGVHKFMLGRTLAGTIMLVLWLIGVVVGSCLIVPIFLSLAMGVIGMVEGIIYLTKSDKDFYRIYAIEKKDWF